MLEGKKVAFIGGGNMGEAILRRLLDASVVAASQVVVAEKTPERQKYLEDTYHVAMASLEKIADAVDFIFLAIKPQQLDALPVFHAQPNTVVISILAGTPIAKIEAHFPGALVVRTMPNLGYTVGNSVTGVFFGDSFNGQSEQAESVRHLLSTGGLVVDVAQEDKLNDITAVSGSGPAYFFWFAEQVAKAAQEFGFSEHEASNMARETMIGAARILEANPGVSLAEFRERVTSKGGTTEAALNVFSSSEADNIVLEALTAARDRSKDLSV